MKNLTRIFSFNEQAVCVSYLSFFIFSVAANNLYAQSLMEEFGAVTTEFNIISDSIEISVLAQAIVKRGEYYSNSGAFSDGAYGYGYGLQSYHLEFLSTSKIIEVNEIVKRHKRDYYEIKLVDDNNNFLLIDKLRERDVQVSTNGKDLTTYSINLNKIPLILLDKTKTVHIAHIQQVDRKAGRKK